MSLKSVDTWFSKYIRLRDSDKDGFIWCISCGNPKHWTKADCGHFVKRQHKALRFNEMNGNAQCRTCNWLLQGNDIEFANGLDRKYGAGTADKLRALQNSTLHLGKFELKVIADHYRMKFNELKKEKGL